MISGNLLAFLSCISKVTRERCRQDQHVLPNVCLYNYIVLLNQQFWSKHNVSLTWKTLPDLRASLYKLPLELRSFSSKLEQSNVKKDTSFTKSEPISWCLKSQPTAPMFFHMEPMILFQIWAISFSKKPSWLQVCSHYTHPVGFNSQPGSWPADQSSAGLRSVVRFLPRWHDPTPETKITPEKRPCSSFQPSIFSKYVYNVYIHMYNYVLYIYLSFQGVFSLL